MNRTATVALAVTPVVLLGSCMGSILLLSATTTQAYACTASGPAVSVDLTRVPTTAIAGYGHAQLVNAALIIQAGKAAGADRQAQTIAVMTAMGESSLTVLNHGDTVGPDSRGLFQQRANGAWGSLTDRMSPTISATNFYRALLAVPGWRDLAPTLAAHRVQANADPYYYETYWASAGAVVAALSAATGAGPSGTPGATPTASSSSAAANGANCVTNASMPASSQGWTKPAIGPITSPYGMRINPVTGVYRLHAGTDIGAPCQAPIYAAAAGVVILAGPASGYGNLIAIDHGGSVITRYGHMYADGILVQVGQHVTAGRQIGQVGAAGTSTGCHLHFEVLTAGTYTNPDPYMRARGIPLG
jgi:murein DD-endopeptidase MepM/ murein hydrolase activator NlpD